jgi:hypothetical protein
MYIWFWISFGRLDFTPNWKSVNSINMKWNSWVTLVLEICMDPHEVQTNVDWVTPTFVRNV